jgi:hypothetical protein
MQARCSKAKLRPCNGSTSAMAVTLAVIAKTLQRTAPAAAANAFAVPAAIRCRSHGPSAMKTMTSAATDSDHNRLAVGGVGRPFAIQPDDTTQ